MIQFEEIVDERQERDESKEPFEPRFNGRIVAIDGSVNVPGRTGWVWVRDQFGGVAPAFNGSVVEAENVPVLINPYRESPTEWIIKGVDYSTLVSGGGDNTGFSLIKQHAETHEWPANIPATDALNIYPQAWTEFRCSPGTGLCISLAGGKYIYQGQWKYFPGLQELDISAHQPASGQALFVLVYVDKATNTVMTSAGTAIDDNPGVKPQAVDIPLNTIPSAYVRLSGDATAFTWADILNARTFINEATEPLNVGNLDGGRADSVYTTVQVIDGGPA